MSIGYTAATLKSQELCLQLQESGQEFVFKFSMGTLKLSVFQLDYTVE